MFNGRETPQIFSSLSGFSLVCIQASISCGVSVILPRRLVVLSGRALSLLSGRALSLLSGRVLSLLSGRGLSMLSGRGLSMLSGRGLLLICSTATGRLVFSKACTVELALSRASIMSTGGGVILAGPRVTRNWPSLITASTSRLPESSTMAM